MSAPFGGYSLTSLLAIIFIVLKLCGLITWSWWWVLSPIWISFIITILIFLMLVILID
jgi:hypothetical protein